jgi:hypothetical protein
MPKNSVSRPLGDAVADKPIGHESWRFKSRDDNYPNRARLASATNAD